ncbi:hypothetical protein PLUA15_550024 [Pseudomonas lundensis]|uniref:Uncharacterized protein n=1 Tax=Pseudomonas lundensis TaxID=86185 RepID=A0AAX2HDD6_9PSED|nr:hypothetical protein PLUA15_550024 [Pseudomonas lundensis]
MNSRVRERDAVSCIYRMREKYKVNPILGLTKGFTICKLESRSTIGQVGDHDEDHNCSESKGRRREDHPRDSPGSMRGRGW